MFVDRPFSQACENNRQPILDILSRVFADRRRVLEVGSGTGQHAVHFARQLPHLVWQTADLPENHAGINAWIDACPADNLRRPLALDADSRPWQLDGYRPDALFSANTCHIMAWSSVVNLFDEVADVLPAGAVLAIYGPFNYGGRFTSDSNARFDAWLKQQMPHQGIREFDAVNRLAEAAGFRLAEDNGMPANNRLLVWRKTENA
jgi:cyclopropane fatty-acyl-phospholipid synthase-like methyltransferase